MLPLLLAAALCAPEPTDLPLVTVDHDNVAIDRSCRVAIPAGKAIDDADGNGVIHITAPGITVRFELGSVLRGSPDAKQPDAYRGVGVRIDKQRGVTITGLHVQGFKAGVWATGCDAITIEDCSFDDLWRQHLKSTPDAEDQSDWLWPHKNDANEWFTNYGAAVYIEDCENATVRDVVVRRGQNGIVLDRVNHAKVYDNDCSFLSGWGVAMWRSSDNLISGNALDFCIRGYSHGVYNRGQDSAGILCFEQCCRNVFTGNSATHSGDGFFGFAGREALGEQAAPTPQFKHEGRGCNENLLLGNDFSFAAAHGIEMTFSFKNRFRGNRLVGNAICGVWGGYSQETVIDENEISDNGLPGTREGGGINIEHGLSNVITSNHFARNSLGVALWGGDAGGLAKTPWYAANHKGSDQNRIDRCSFRDERLAVRLRKSGLTGVTMNTYEGVEKEIDSDTESKQQPFHLVANEFPAPKIEAIGKKTPVGARKDLAGRQQIVMTEWGPWDHHSPLVRTRSLTGAVHTYELFDMPDHTAIELTAPDGSESRGFTAQADTPTQPNGPTIVRVVATEPGVHGYKLSVHGGDVAYERRGTLVSTRWKGRAFAATSDPREKYDAWKAEGAKGAAFECDTVDWALGYGGPSKIKALGEAVAAAKLPTQNYGITASASVPLAPGKWRLKTLSDDGVRVKVTTGGGVGGVEPFTKTLIDNWTHHGPTSDAGEFTIPDNSAGVVVIDVEYFQLDGFAVLKLEIEPAK